jgi:hypothetical protein
MSTKTKLLIFEYKERFPILSAEDISRIFALELESVEKLFTKKEIIVPSKMN